MKKEKIYVFSAVAISMIIAVSAYLSQGQSIGVFSNNQGVENTNVLESADIRHESVADEVYSEKDIEITIGAVGDIMVHGPQLSAQYDSKKKQYSFKNNFAFVKPYIEKMDLAVANFETTLAGPSVKYSSYPTFNSPDAIADALKNTGFDVLSTINNHTYDKKRQGYIRTLQVLNRKNIPHVGGRLKELEPNFLIKDVKGIKIGITAYSYETKKTNGRKTLNGNIVDKDIEGLINTFDYGKLNEELAKMKKQIALMRKNGAEVIVFYIHWGQEYQRQPNEYQKKMAQFLANENVDIIFGSHPHVLQPAQYVKSQYSENKTLVAYSLGNFLSNQRHEIMSKKYTEDGMILQVTIHKHVKYDKDQQINKVYIKDVKYIPTWVNRYTSNRKSYYEIVPLEDLDKSKYNLEQSGTFDRAVISKQNTEELINSSDIKLYK